jgi:hypothetical protein
MRVAAGILLLACAAAAQEGRAAKLVREAAETADSMKETWKRLALEPDQVTDDELDAILAAYERAVDLYQGALEIEELPSVNGPLVLLAQRLSKLEYERFWREQRRKRAEEAARGKPEPPPETKPEAGAPAPPPTAVEMPEPEPAREPPPAAATPPGVPPYPAVVETKEQARRNQQQLRNFIMNDYFAPRKQTALLTRCSVCQGTGRQPTGRLDERRRPVTIPCGGCNNAGYLLNVTPARKGYWLTQSPLHRADDANRAAFDAKLAEWKADPRRMTEFLKRVSIGDVEYHGLWAKVKIRENGFSVEHGKAFERNLEKTFLRIGRRWFLYDEKFDRDLFAAAAAED